MTTPKRAYPMSASGWVPSGYTWCGTRARIKPSGYVHLIEWVRHAENFDRDLALMACGKEARRSYLTRDFPPASRHCPSCFPEVTPVAAGRSPSPEHRASPSSPKSDSGPSA